MAFDQAAIASLYSQISSQFKASGAFKSVIRHEPKAAPSGLPALALWWDGIGPASGVSGLAATSARVEFAARIYTDDTKSDDETEAQLMRLTSIFIGAFTAAFTLDDEVMQVDLLGKYGEALSAKAGWVEHDNHQYRAAQCVIPLICDGLWVQVP